MAQSVFPVEVAAKQFLEAQGNYPDTRYSILIKGYDEPFTFTLPWPRCYDFEAHLIALHQYLKPKDDGLNW